MVLSRLNLDGDISMHALSGGWRRRVCWRGPWCREPDLLLLDEPTNHLDIDTITWLEEFLVDFTGALLFVTHDRAFLKRLATRIVELDRGALTSWPGSYDDYVRRKQDQLEVEAAAQRAVRQEAGPGGDLDPPGRQGTAHTQRRPGTRAGGPARTSPPAPRPRRQGETPAGRGRVVRPAGVRGRARRFQLRRHRRDQGLFGTRHARRSHRHRRPQRLRQVHPDQTAAGRAAAARGHAASRHQHCRSPISTSSAPTSTD